MPMKMVNDFSERLESDFGLYKMTFGRPSAGLEKQSEGHCRSEIQSEMFLADERAFARLLNPGHR